MPNSVDLLIKHRWLFFILSLCLISFSFAGFKHFIFDASPRSYFEAGHKPYEAFLNMEDTYGRDFKIFIMLSATEGDIFDDAQLQALLEITEKSWSLPYVRRVDSLSNYQYTYSGNDELIVEDFLSEEMLDEKDTISLRKKAALNDPELINRLISKDAKHAAIHLSLSMTGAQAQGEEAKGLVNKAYEIQKHIEKHYSTSKVYVSGNVVSTYSNVEIAEGDFKLMIPVMFALMFVLLGILFKSGSCIVISLIVAMLAAISGLGMAAWFNIIFSPLAINAVIISITVAVAHCIHIFTQLFHELKTKPKMEALTESLRVNFFAVSMTSLTTIIGFLSLNTNDLPPAVALGNAAAIGTALAWIFSFTMLPALVSILPFKAHKTSTFFIEHLMLRMANTIIRHKYPVLLTMIAVCIVALQLSFNNTLNDKLAETIHKPHKFRTANDAIDQHFGAMFISNYDLDGGDENGIASPEYLKQMDKLVQYLRQQPEISNVYAISDTIKRLNQSMHNNNPDFYYIPDDRKLIAQYILLYEMSLPYGLDLNNQITTDKSRSVVIATTPSMDTKTTIILDKRINQWITENMPTSMQAQSISISTIWAYLTEDSLTNALKGAVTALVLISAVLLFMLKSIRYGIISLIPNLLPASFGFAFWYLYSGNVGLALMCVLIITIGIVVDDTVHFLVKYQKALKDHNGDSEKAVRTTFKQVGPALFITTLVLASGFSILWLSQIIINSALGQVTAVILIAAFVLDILLLPVLLMLIDKKPNKLKPA